MKMKGFQSFCVLCAREDPIKDLHDIQKFGLSKSEDILESQIRAHDFCWERLIKHFDGAPDFEKLVRIIQETPPPNYRKNCKNRNVISGINLIPDINDLKSLKSLGIQKLLRPLRSQKNVPKSWLVNAKFQNASEDCFQSLPLEIRTSIAQYLSTADFFNLRLSSKAMAVLFEIQQFWKTRFSLHGKLGYLSFLEEESYQNWRLLYRYIRPDFVWPILLDDWRLQWLKNENIRDRYIMIEDAGCVPTDSSIELEGLYGSLKWDTIPARCANEVRRRREGLWSSSFGTALLQNSHIKSLPVSNFSGSQCGRCGQPGFLTKTHIVSVSDLYPISKIAVYVLVENEDTFISGFDLIHRSGIPDTNFGYKIPGKQVVLDLHGHALNGFQLGISFRAIHAIRPITEEERSPTIKVGDQYWAGNQRHRTLKSTQAASNSRIMAISGDFQDQKLVGLAVGSGSNSLVASV